MAKCGLLMSREDRESKILDILEEQKSIHYMDLSVQLGVSTETARRTAILLAKKYPNNIEYYRGMLRLTKSLTLEDLPPEKKAEALKTTLKSMMEEREKLKEKLKRNHFPHIKKALMEQDLKKLEAEIKRLEKELLGE